MSRIGYAWNRVLKKLTGTACMNVTKKQPCKIGAGSTVINTVIEKRTYIGYDCLLMNCEIGKFCSIADQVIIGVGGEHPMEWVTTSSAFFNPHNKVSEGLKMTEYTPEVKKTIVGNDVWIGRRAIIKNGISIGNGAVIGTASVVTKSVPPYAIVAGVPARVIRYRFDEETRQKLNASQWWDYSDEALGRLSKYIPAPESFITETEKLNGIEK